MRVIRIGERYSIATGEVETYDLLPVKTYVAMYPTDVQFDGASQKAQTNYCKMTQQIDKVLKSMKLL